MSDGNAAQLRRSYERNLGHSRFWAGAGAALLAAFLLFVADVLLAASRDPGAYTSEVSFAFLVGAWMLGIATGLCFLTAAVFNILYRQDDGALAEIERAGQNATP